MMAAIGIFNIAFIAFIAVGIAMGILCIFLDGIAKDLNEVKSDLKKMRSELRSVRNSTDVISEDLIESSLLKSETEGLEEEIAKVLE